MVQPTVRRQADFNSWRAPSRPTTPPALRPVAQIFQTAQQTAQVIEVTIREYLEDNPEFYERYFTRADAIVCPICFPLHGIIRKQGFGPYPPQHPHCRCTRRYAFTVHHFFTVRLFLW